MEYYSSREINYAPKRSMIFKVCLRPFADSKYVSVCCLHRGIGDFFSFLTKPGQNANVNENKCKFRIIINYNYSVM